MALLLVTEQFLEDAGATPEQVVRWCRGEDLPVGVVVLDGRLAPDVRLVEAVRGRDHGGPMVVLEVAGSGLPGREVVIAAPRFGRESDMGAA